MSKPHAKGETAEKGATWTDGPPSCLASLASRAARLWLVADFSASC